MFKELDVPLADVLIETGIGVAYMNHYLGENNVGATSASVKIRFVASMTEGHDYTNHVRTSSGAKFRFLFFGGGGTKTQRSTSYHQYHRYAEHIFIEVNVNFEQLPDVTEPSA